MSTDEMLTEKYYPYWYLYAESDGQGIKYRLTEVGKLCS